MSAGAMLEAGASFMDVATREIDHLKNLFIQEREIRFRLEKENFELRANLDGPTSSSSRTKRRANTTDCKGKYFYAHRKS